MQLLESVLYHTVKASALDLRKEDGKRDLQWSIIVGLSWN